MHSKQHTRVLGERVLKVARNLTNLLFSVLTRNWLHHTHSGYQHKGNSVAYLNRLEVTSANQLKEPATWVYSVTGQHGRNPTLGAVLEINALTLCIANALRKPWSILIFLMLVSNICWICSFVFNGSVSKPAFFGEQCPKDETWWKQHRSFHDWIPRRPDLRNCGGSVWLRLGRP